jgi:hypothetical protein
VDCCLPIRTSLGADPRLRHWTGCGERGLRARGMTCQGHGAWGRVPASYPQTVRVVRVEGRLAVCQRPGPAWLRAGKPMRRIPGMGPVVSALPLGWWVQMVRLEALQWREPWASGPPVALARARMRPGENRLWPSPGANSRGPSSKRMGGIEVETRGSRGRTRTGCRSASVSVWVVTHGGWRRGRWWVSGASETWRPSCPAWVKGESLHRLREWGSMGLLLLASGSPSLSALRSRVGPKRCGGHVGELGVAPRLGPMRCPQLGC